MSVKGSPLGPIGATGPAGPTPGATLLQHGQWYALRIDGREFYAVVATEDYRTGYLVLHEIPDPWVCATCGESYIDGPHTERGATGDGSHGYRPRGYPPVKILDGPA